MLLADYVCVPNATPNRASCRCTDSVAGWDAVSRGARRRRRVDRQAMGTRLAVEPSARIRTVAPARRACYCAAGELMSGAETTGAQSPSSLPLPFPLPLPLPPWSFPPSSGGGVGSAVGGAADSTGSAAGSDAWGAAAGRPPNEGASAPIASPAIASARTAAIHAGSRRFVRLVGAAAWSAAAGGRSGARREAPAEGRSSRTLQGFNAPANAR